MVLRVARVKMRTLATGSNTASPCVLRDRPTLAVRDLVARDFVNGFTLVELMVVLVILGLASAAVVLAVPDPRGRVSDEAERFAARALAVRDDAIIQGRSMSIRIDGQGYSIERRARGRWETAGDRASAPGVWAEGTGVTSDRSRVTFDTTGAVDEPTTVTLSRDGISARIDVSGNGAVRVAR